ncbi:LysR substrate-binding domain-containing protein [Solirubrobacter phytolaccae]|uniref:LysR substrate-binding domain-containing protein n=1 Tax=Solirubrobacter phytolaccae TaxID=1404360 RepID=A0A9X3SBX6_9ACTN|nr:LysR substrate-binding domain-containing protein [Solirubrobacter phytolaccae]MDA0184026.1 LysR substrate-binding domain-containing protein [Solirubrobacter phytolaccae]
MRTSELPSLNAIRAFEAASRHLNFRLAAEELGVSQGAVAQHVRGLEDRLGVKLFDRLPRTLALTDPGRRYASTIRRAFELIVEGTANVRPAPLRLQISVTPTFAAKWLLPRLPDFTAAHPDLDLGIIASERRTTFHSDDVDLAVRFGSAPSGPNMTVDLLFKEELIAVCSPGLVADAQLPLAAEALSGYTLLQDSHGQWPQFIETVLEHSAAGASTGVRFNQTSLAIDAALGGQGIALASRHFVERDLAAGRLVNPFGAALDRDAGFYVVTPRRPRHPGPTAAVKAWLLSHARA